MNLTEPEQKFLEVVFETTDRIQRGFTKSTDSWNPVLFLAAENRFDVASLDFSTDESKALMFQQAIPQLIIEERAIAAATLTEAWGVWFSKNDPRIAELRAGSIAPPSQQPDRTEWLILTLFPTQTLYRAPILRSPGKPPRLGDWIAQERSITSQGQAITPIARALAAVAAGKEGRPSQH